MHFLGHVRETLGENYKGKFKGWAWEALKNINKAVKSSTFHKRTKNHIIFQGPVQFVIIKNLKNKICPHKVEVRALRVSLRLECTQLNTFCTQVLRILELK